MTSIDPETDRLNVDPKFKPIKQKRRKFVPDHNQIINKEIEKPLVIGSVREVHYPDLFVNVVVICKKNGIWRVCIDFTDLNKVFSKTSFPFPYIDTLVDATTGHELLSFMDAFSDYNQILKHLDNYEKTAFITKRKTYYHKVMPFDLKNAGATYQRLVNQIFVKLIGKTMVV